MSTHYKTQFEEIQIIKTRKIKNINYLGLLLGDAVKHEASLEVVQQTELLVGLRDGDDIHEADREVDVSADLKVNLEKYIFCKIDLPLY